MVNLKKKTVNGLKWSAIERVVTQVVQLVIMLILGRMLGPEAFGLIGMLAIFIAISKTFVDSGFSSALIRKQDVNESDFATTFYFNVIVASSCYAILFFCAPFIADFYNQHELIDLTRVLSLTILVNAFSVVQRARLTINMDFKSQARSSLFSVLCSALIALILAHYNFGVWSLVIQTLSFSIFNVLLLSFFNVWYPKCGFSIASFKSLFGFSSKLLISALIDAIYNNIYQIIIGKSFSANQLGVFSQAKLLSLAPAVTLTDIVQRVTYPILSRIQDNNKSLSDLFLLILRLTSVVIFPIILGLALTAKPLVLLILGVEWAYTAELIVILCLGYMLIPIHMINLSLLQVKGRSDLFLRIEIVKKIMLTLMLFITVPIGIESICIGIAIQSYLAVGVNGFYTSRVINISLFCQFRAVIRFWILAFICAGIGSMWFFVISNHILQIVLSLTTFWSLYYILIKNETYDMFDLVKNSLSEV